MNEDNKTFQSIYQNDEFAKITLQRRAFFQKL